MNQTLLQKVTGLTSLADSYKFWLAVDFDVVCSIGSRVFHCGLLQVDHFRIFFVGYHKCCCEGFAQTNIGRVQHGPETEKTFIEAAKWQETCKIDSETNSASATIWDDQPFVHYLARDAKSSHLFSRVEVSEDFSVDHLGFRNYQRWRALFQFWFSAEKSIFQSSKISAEHRWFSLQQLWRALIFLKWGCEFAVQFFEYFNFQVF